MKKIILVDDTEICRDVAQNVIEKVNKDFLCIVFSDPREVLKYLLEEDEVYAVVSDYEMPGLNGLQMAKKIIEELPEMKIIVMSSHETEFLETTAKKLGIEENTVKFLCKTEILDLIDLLDD